MSANSRRLAAIKSGKKPSAEHFCETTHDEIDTSAAEFLGHLDDSAKDFLVRLLARDPAERLGDAGVHSHAFFEEVCTAATLLRARTGAGSRVSNRRWTARTFTWDGAHFHLGRRALSLGTRALSLGTARTFASGGGHFVC